MKTFPGVVVIALLVTSCAMVVPVPSVLVEAPIIPATTEMTAPQLAAPSSAGAVRPSASPRPATNYFDYRIDPVIAGRYGTTGEVAWADGGPGQRPVVSLFGEEMAYFQPGVTAEDLKRFSTAFDATVRGPWIIPGTPDGAIPPKASNTYYVTFRTENVSLDGLDALAEATGLGGGWVFSSEQGAKIFHQILCVRQQAEQYKVVAIGGNGLICFPEDCGPDGGPVPVYPSTVPMPAPTPTPTPETQPMALKNVVCVRTSIPQGKQGILRVTGILSASCWAAHEVKAIVDDERREVRLEATAKRMTEVCQLAVGYPETEVPFYPARLGTYRIIATVDDGGDKPRELSCEVEVVAQQ